MEGSQVFKKHSEKALLKKEKFKIRRRKSFIDENGENTLKMWKNKELLNNNSLTKSKRNSQQKKNYIQNKIRNSSFFSVLNYKNIEEEIKHIILEMRRTCLWEMRKQSYDLKMIQSENEEVKKSNLPGKFSSKNLYNNCINELGLDIKSKEQKFNQTHINNQKDFIKQIYSNNMQNEEKINNNNFNGRKPKSASPQNISKIHKIKHKNLDTDKFRFLSRGRLVIDSNDENESEEEQESKGCLILLNKNIIFFYDLLITLAVFYSLLYIPYELGNSFCICYFFNDFLKFGFNIFIDFLFFVDLIINFFLEVEEREEKIVFKMNLKIIKNYIFGWFFIDFLSSLPFSFISFKYCRKHSNIICHTYEIGNKIYLLHLFRCIKSIKIFKIEKKKKIQFISKIEEKCLDNILLDNIFYAFNKILFVLIGLHLISCIHIFIGKHSFPGWIYKNELQNATFWKLYIISIYYITMTLTTVGYGDILPNSFLEINFRVILLAVGIVGYSWLISSISNGINKENFASINYSNECQILEEIRMEHQKIPYKLYLNIINHLKQKHFYQKKYDKNLLFNTLPYSLKNNLIFSMYKRQIKQFDFFKNISNSNFLVDVLSCFSPISSLKDDILLRENDLIEEIFFVDEGKLSLEVSIDIINPEESINKYLSNEFLNLAFDFDINTSFSQIQKYSRTTSTFVSKNQINVINNMNKKEKKLVSKNVYLKIHDIHKNEDFGDIFMFFRKRSPFALRVKSKRAKLLVIKKSDFTKISNQYKNIFKSINKKKKHNFNIIKNIMIKTIIKFCNSKEIKINERYHDIIRKAVNELNKEIIPLDILKNAHFKNEINEIDDEINKTIQAFDKEISHLNSELIINKKSKIFGNIKKVKTSNIKFKHFLLEDLNSSTESKYYTSSIKKKKKNHKTKITSNIKTNVQFNKKFDKINFNFSDSGESIKTEEIKKEDKETSEIGPNTIQNLPQSLINLIKQRIKMHNSENLKDNKSQEENIFICINNNYNYGNNINNINNTNIINNIENNNIKKNKNSSTVTFDSIFTNKLGEINLNLKKNEGNKKLKKSNFTSISLYKLNPENFSLLSPKLNYNEINKNNNKFFSFDSLLSTSVDSFEIKRSYKNINQITEGEYIKNKKFQENTIKYIKIYKKNFSSNKIIDKKEKKKIKSDLDIKKNDKRNNNGNKKHKKSINYNIISNNIKKYNNKMNKKNLSMINDISLSSFQFRNNSTQNEMSYNSKDDNFNINNINNVYNNNICNNDLHTNKYDKKLKKNTYSFEKRKNKVNTSK